MSFSGRFVVAERQRSREISSIYLQEVASAGFQPLNPNIVRSRQWETNVHGTIRPRRKQEIDAISLAAYLIVVAAAAMATLIHPKPELIPLLLWYAGHPL